MSLIFGSVATLAVAVIFCIWHTYAELRTRRERTLRARVAFLLWTVAEHCSGDTSPRLGVRI